MHCRPKESAKRMTDYYSVLSTAMDYGLDIFKYLNFIYYQLKSGEKDYEKLCPWNKEVIIAISLTNY